MNNTINRRVLIKSLLLLLFPSSFSLADRNNYNKFTIIFGSCSNQNNKMDHWQTIINYEPDLVILLGDNVYGDFNNESANQLKQAYKKLSENNNFQVGTFDVWYICKIGIQIVYIIPKLTLGLC